MNEFLQRLKKAAQNVWQWVKSLPVVKPLYALLYSRKAMISAAIVYFMLEQFPKLAPFENYLALIASQVVVVALVAIANILGIAMEDAAAKSNGGSAG